VTAFKEKKSNITIIIGGGPAGLTAAYELSKANRESIVLEKDEMVGGISRTVSYKNYHFDIGGHRFFTKIDEVNEMWAEVLGEDFLHRKRMSRIYYNKKFFHYPLRPMNALFGLGLWNSTAIILSYIYANVFPLKDEESFEQWVTNHFGKRLYETFFKTYTEKVWGIPCSEIKADWAAQRVRGLSLMSAVRNALINPGKSGGNRPFIKTLIDSFHYPKYGPGMMWQTVAEIVQKNGSQVWLGAEVRKILWKDNSVEAVEITLNGKEKLVEGCHFICSMPIRELLQRLTPAAPEEVLKAANDLKYRDFLTVALIVNKAEVFPDNWIYIHDPAVKVGRVQNFKNWSPYMVPDTNKSCLGLEYFCFEGDGLWTMSDSDLVALAKEELERVGLVSKKDVEDGIVVRMPKAYPVYDAHYKESLRVVRQFLSNIDNLQLVGRNGMHRYNNQDHSMLTAMRAVENICGANHNLWEINTEEEYHEEDKVLIPDEILVRSFARMDGLGFATAVGSVFGLLIFIATLWLILKGGNVVGPNLQLLGQYFIGYSVTVEGAFIGMAYSFFWGFLFGWLFAYLRNLCLALFIYQARRKTEMLSFKDFVDNF
jgi:protoporphyrinogen oxidase